LSITDIVPPCQMQGEKVFRVSYSTKNAPVYNVIQPNFKKVQLNLQKIYICKETIILDFGVELIFIIECIFSSSPKVKEPIREAIIQMHTHTETRKNTQLMSLAQAGQLMYHVETTNHNLSFL
jgi:hypothetical protein